MYSPQEILDYANAAGVISTLGLSIRDNGRGQISFLCPFHDDRHFGSAFASSDGLYHCFACGKGGNLISLVREMRNCSYPEAVRFIAAASGLDPDNFSSTYNAAKNGQAILTVYEKNVLGMPGLFMPPEIRTFSEKKKYRKLVSERAGRMLVRYMEMEKNVLSDMSGIVPDDMKDTLLPYVGAEIRKRVKTCREIAERFR